MVSSTRRFAHALPLIVLVTLTWAPTSAAAQAADMPMVVTRSFAPIPHGWAFDVEPRDDSDANLRLRDVLAEELRARAYLAAIGAPLRLRFTTDRVTPTTTSEQVASLGGNGSPNVGDDLPGALLLDPVGAAPRREGGPFAPPRFDHPIAVVSYRLRATVETRSGRVLWQGEASAAASRAGEQMLGRELAAALVAEIGRTVDPKVLGGVGGP